MSGGFRPPFAADHGAHAASGLLRHHRRSRQRPDLARLRSHARARADSRFRRRLCAQGDRQARNARRHRPNSVAMARPAPRPRRPSMADVNPFTLDPRLEADTILVGEMALSRLLLMNDARFPWL